MPVDVSTSKAAIEQHQNLYPIIAAVPVDDFKEEIQSLRERVVASGQKQALGPHSSATDIQNGSIVSSPNPDLISAFPHIEQLLQNLVITR